MGALSAGFGWSFCSVGGRRPGQIGDTVLRPRSEKDVEPGPSQPSWETQACCSLPASLPGDVRGRSLGGVSGGRVWIRFKFRES